jgi:hypothetical protein
MPRRRRRPWPARPGDEVRVGRSVLLVLQVDARRCVCQLVGGSRVIRRVRGPQIECVVRRAGELEPVLDELNDVAREFSQPHGAVSLERCG